MERTAKSLIVGAIVNKVTDTILADCDLRTDLSIEPHAIMLDSLKEARTMVSEPLLYNRPFSVEGEQRTVFSCLLNIVEAHIASRDYHLDEAVERSEQEDEAERQRELKEEGF